jgi:protein-disulfide isomerase
MKRNHLKLLIAGALAAALAVAIGLPAWSDDATVLAVVNGKPITEADVRSNAASQFSALEREYQQNKHKLIEDALKSLIEERLLDAEAAARGVGRDELTAEMKAAPVTDADVDAFYEQNKAQIPRPKEQVAGQIKTYLEQTGQQKARGEYIKKLEAKYAVDYKIEPIRVEVAANGPSKGPAGAPVTIVEFSDFQCPYCARLIPTLDQLKAKYGDKVRIVFRQYPLNFHQFAQKAAEASLCAHDQGKFWELHDAMFGNQQALAVEQLKAKAAELGMNSEAFNACIDTGKHAEVVAADFKEGAAAGVSGTPAMFVNGRFISGAVPLEQIAEVVDDELRRKGVKN